MDAFICNGVSTPIGRYGGGPAGVRTDDLGALPIQALMARHPGMTASGYLDPMRDIRISLSALPR